MKFVKKIMLFVFVLLILTGCGRDDDKIIMVTEAGFAPYEYYDNEVFKDFKKVSIHSVHNKNLKYLSNSANRIKNLK